MSRISAQPLQESLAMCGRRAYNALVHVSRVPLGDVGATPRSPIWQRDNVTLFRYRRSLPDAPTERQAGGRSGSRPEADTRRTVLLVHSLVTRPYVFDLRPGNSLVEELLDAGFDVCLLDWGSPGPAEAHNTLETYCGEYLPRAIEHLANEGEAGTVDVIGYCLGALFALITLATHPELPVRRLVALATPIDLGHLAPFAGMFAEGRLEPDDVIDETGNVPARTMLEGMRLIEPAGRLTTALSLWSSLDSLGRLAAYQSLIDWSEDQIPFPGATLRQIVADLLRGRKLLLGSLRLSEKPVSFAAIPCPVLSVIGDRDTLVPPASTAPLKSLLPADQLTTLHLPAGHTGLFVGRSARTNGVPAIVSWLKPGP